MTRKFNVHNLCSFCGRQTTAETGFGRWMRNNAALDSRKGIVRTDTDHTILRYKTHDQGRDVRRTFLEGLGVGDVARVHAEGGRCFFGCLAGFTFGNFSPDVCSSPLPLSRLPLVVREAIGGGFFFP